MPRFLAEAGLVVTIGLAFAPSILRSAAEVRDAQRLRGHRARGIRGAVPLVVPVLAGALERAVTLAESMESRGYGRVADGLHRDEALARAGVLASLISLATGLGLVVFGRGPLALRWVMLGAAAAGTGASLRALSRLVPRTRFRPERLDGFDGALAAGSVAVAAAVAAAARGPGGRWYAYPSVSWPVLDAGTVALAACVALPVALAAARAARLARASRRAIVPQGARA
ncbi:MAG: hypothetical protein HY775_03240 [Acidobacteria bacterium]|nr:hypothetical protein [Acidobacteriota bacterium]